MNRENFTYIKIFCNLAIFALSMLLVLWILPKLLVFFMPFVVAWLIACIATPIVRFIEKHLKLKRRVSMVCVVIIIIGLIISAFYGIGVQTARFLAGFIEELPQLWENFRAEAHNTLQLLLNILNKLPGNGAKDVESFLTISGDAVTKLIGEWSTPTILAVGNIAKRVPDILIFTIMCVLATYFFVVEREGILQKVANAMPKSFLHIWDIVKRCFVTSIGGYFKAQFKIEIWIYLLVFIGLSILKIRYAFVIALVIAALDLLPVFGTGAVLWPWALIEVMNGSYLQAMWLMIIWGLAQLVRQFIQPKYVGETLGVAPLPTLIFLFAGYRLAGVWGMIVAVPLVILVVRLYQEGVFVTTEQSIKLLAGRIQKLRKFSDEELQELEKYEKF